MSGERRAPQTGSHARSSEHNPFDDECDVVQQLSATRSELLARRAQISLATQGRDLLKEKRAALMREFERTSGSILQAVAKLGRRAAEGRDALSDAVAFDGAETVGSAALAASGDV